jgi:hypothetical protein
MIDEEKFHTPQSSRSLEDKNAAQNQNRFSTIVNDATSRP